MLDRLGTSLRAVRRQLASVRSGLTETDRKLVVKNLFLAITFLIVGKVLAAMAPLIFKRVVDSLSSQPPLLEIASLSVLGFATFRFLSIAFAELREVVFAKFAQPCVQAVASTALRKLMSLPLVHFSAKRSSEYPILIERGIRGMELFLSLVAFSVVPAIVELALVCVLVGLFVDVRYAALLATSAIVFVVFTIVATDRQDSWRREMNRTSAEFGLRLREAAANIEVVQAFYARSAERERSLEELRRYGRATIRNQVASLALHTGQGAVVSLALGGCLLLMVSDIVAGHASVGALIMLSMYMFQLFDPLSFLSYSYRNMRDGLIDTEGLVLLLQQKADDCSFDKQAPASASGWCLEMANIEFGYLERQRALSAVSLTVNRGSVVAIVGQSGVGKSTIAKLLVGLLEPCFGQLVYKNISEAAGAQPRISYVPQDPQLFSDTIRHNIAYGRWSATENEVVDAAHVACIDRVIVALPDGYSTILGSRGDPLSGGERQRIAIARAILMRPNILMLDEGTSDLDLELEQRILSNIKTALKDDLVIFVTHRISATWLADQVVVVDDGTIIESGPPHQLMAGDGHYARLARAAAPREVSAMTR